MERRGHFLAVIASITIAIVVVLLVGLYLFYPAEGSDTVAEPQEGSDEIPLFDPVEYLKREREAVDVVDAIVRDTTPDSATARARPRGERISNNIATDNGVVLYSPVVAPPQSAQEEAERLRSALKGSQPSTAATQSATTRTRRDTVVTPTPTPVAARTVTPRAIPPTPSSARDRRVAHYWIQLFSSNRLESTQRAEIELEKYQIEGVVSQKQINGKDYYRLRVGPFLTSGEAEKFIGWFQNSDQFVDSYVVHARLQ